MTNIYMTSCVSYYKETGYVIFELKIQSILTDTEFILIFFEISPNLHHLVSIMENGGSYLAISGLTPASPKNSTEPT